MKKKLNPTEGLPVVGVLLLLIVNGECSTWRWIAARGMLCHV